MKFQRQAKILDLIDKHEIETQEELSEQLRNMGYNTTQATVSRDIKELRLIKILSAETGKYKYAVASSEVESSFTTRLRNIFKECVTDINTARWFVSCWFRCAESPLYRHPEWQQGKLREGPALRATG